VEKISLAVNNYFASLDAGTSAEDQVEGAAAADVEAVPEESVGAEALAAVEEAVSESQAETESAPAETLEREPQEDSAAEKTK